ncbi:MAG: thiamine phosphate synthase [Alphaproteobacteria bacterium]
MSDAMSDAQTGLYLITPPRLLTGELDLRDFADDLGRALDAAAVASVQLRLKGVDDDTLRRACDTLRAVAHDRDVAFLVNDRPDIAQATGCDGAHIGQEDMAYEDARDILGEEAILGVTCHASRDLAFRAGEAGADYVAFGAFYPSPTKTRVHAPEPELLAWWREATVVPSVAIGGIGAENCAPLVRAGADFIAVCSYVWDHPEGPAAAIRRLASAVVAASDGNSAIESA